MLAWQTPSSASPERAVAMSMVTTGSSSADLHPSGDTLELGRKRVIGGPDRLRSTIWVNLMAASFLAYIFALNVSTISDFRMPHSLAPVGTLLRLEQKWSMFSPYPNKRDGWFVIPGELQNGKKVELSAVTLGDFSVHEDVNWEKPHRVADTFKDLHWRKYMVNLLPSQHEELRRYFGKYVCREWDARHDEGEDLQRFQLYYMVEPTLPDYRTVDPSRVLLWRHRCS